jgi:SAM-dependent methyltransferase
MILFLKIFLLAGISFLLFIFFSLSTIKAAIIGAPFVPTPKSIIRKALRLADLKPNEKLCDLGSGTGRVLITAAKEFGARVIGFEYSLPLFYLSKINLFLNKIKNGVVYRKNFYEANISDADVVFLFLTPRAFRKLEDKFNKELKPGTRVVTFSSPLLFWKPKEIIPLPERNGKINLYLYVKE